MKHRTRRARQLTPIAKRSRGDLYWCLKLSVGEEVYDLVVVPHRDMISNIVLEGIGQYIGEIIGLQDHPLLNGNEEAAKALQSENMWSCEAGKFTISSVYWVDEDVEKK